MTDSSTSVSTKHLQQLRERLELYNATAIDSAVTAAASSAQAKYQNRLTAEKPTRPAPSASPLATSKTPTMISKEEQAAPRLHHGNVVYTKAGDRMGKGAAGLPDGSPPHHTSASSGVGPIGSPGPAPQTARSLSSDFVGSVRVPPTVAATNERQDMAAATQGSSMTPSDLQKGRFAPGVAPAVERREPSPTIHPAGRPMMMSPPRPQSSPTSEQPSGSRPELWHGDDDDDDDVEYEVEEIEEEYEEELETSDESEEGRVAPSLDRVLQRLFRTYGPPPNEISSSALQFDAKAKGSSGGATTTPTATSSFSQKQHSLIQRAAELYCQRREALERSDAGSSKWTFSHNDAESRFTRGGKSESESTTSTSSVATTRLTTSDDEGGSDAGAEIDRNSGSPIATSTPPDVTDAAFRSLSPFSVASLKERLQEVLKTTGAEDATSPAAPADPARASPLRQKSLTELETAYRQVVLGQHGVGNIFKSCGSHCFPGPLPQQERHATLVARRDELIAEDVKLRSNPPDAVPLEAIKANLSLTIDSGVTALVAQFDSVMRYMKPVEDREAAIRVKKQLLDQRQADLTLHRGTRATMEREVTALQEHIASRTEALKRREESYAARLLYHDKEQASVQALVEEVDALNKTVSVWLPILDDRERRLQTKETRLQDIKTDLLRRSEDVNSWKKAFSKRSKSALPPPSPPRIS